MALLGVPKRNVHLWNTYVMLLMNIVGYHVTSCQQNDVTFHLEEQKPYGTYVGNVAVASDIQRNISDAMYESLRYNFLNPNSLQTASLFIINRKTGAINTAAMIDREKVKRSDKEVCAYFPECVIEFDVTVQSNNSGFLKIITVKIIIDDINDSSPTFEPNEIQIAVSESVNAGSKIPIDGATDKDTDERNSVQSYEITSYKDMFNVEFVRKLDGSSSLKLVVLKGLDREKRDRYRFKILAKDGGMPPLTGTLVVNMNVIDINDNDPVFSKSRYEFIVKETTPVNSRIGTVSAKDSDVGKNGRVIYRFSQLRPSKLEELFTLEETTGILRVKTKLQYESGNTFEAVIEAQDKGETPQASQAKLVITIQDVGNTPPKVELTLASSVVYGDTILLSEGTRVGSFVGRVKVEDNDAGRNGEVHCRSLADHFLVDKLDGQGYAILISREMDRETQRHHNVTILCEDAGSPRMYSTASFKVDVTDINDNSPIFTQEVYNTTVVENDDRTVTLVTVKAVDADDGINAEITYYLSVDVGSPFSIDPDTGEIRASGSFDRETESEISFIVKAANHGDNPRTGSAKVTVHILDVNDNRPSFPPTPLRFHIPEHLPVGRSVGQLTAIDYDVGMNAALQYSTRSNDPSMPFVIFSDGVIRTERELDREIQEEYQLPVYVTDNGHPPLGSNGTVTVVVDDMNDHSPIITFPNLDNNTISLYSDTLPGSRVVRVTATDEDIGRNALLSFYITGGNKDNAFIIGKDSGEVTLNRHLTVQDDHTFRLTISVEDNGRPSLKSQTLLNIEIILTNSTIFASRNIADVTHKYIIIAGIVAGVTVILSIIIVSIILFIRRNDNLRREAQEKMGVQEECGKREMERRIWQEVNAEDIKAGFEDHESNHKVYKPKMDKDRSFTIDPDRPPGESFLCQSALEQCGKPEFFTFRKSHGPPFSEDVRSDASGETTTSDSGRGGSEEDIQLPALPDLKGFNSNHQIFSVAIDENDEYPPHIPPRELREKSRTLTTFSNPNMANKISLPQTSSFRDIHNYNADPNFRNNQRNQHKVRFSTDNVPNGQRFHGNGKQVTFPKEYGRPNVPIISNNVDYLSLKHNHDPAALSYRGSYNSLPRSVDDDDNTTTSGSYTLNPEDFEEVFCER